jgi:hypothetical protein
MIDFDSVGSLTTIDVSAGGDPADSRGTTVSSKREYSGGIAKEMSRHG